ncbi:hypothetical protein [Bacteroides clarus]|uniref:hypothetical protein n=2 Tax=Bacteroides TaxID=816 RepID=UPI003522E166
MIVVSNWLNISFFSDVPRVVFLVPCLGIRYTNGWYFPYHALVLQVPTVGI